MELAAAVGCLIALLVMSPAHAQTNNDLPDVEFGDGVFASTEGGSFDGAGSMRGAAHIRPITQLGADTFRYTEDPASGLRKGYVFEGSRAGQNAVLIVTWLDRASDLRWRQTRRMSFRLSNAEYEELAHVIDEQLQRGQQFAERLQQGEGATWLCVDGAYLLTERVRDGRESWMMGDCGLMHPNAEIEAQLRAFVLDRLGD